MTAGAVSATWFHIYLYCSGEDLWEENIFTPHRIADLVRGAEHWNFFSSNHGGGEGGLHKTVSK